MKKLVLWLVVAAALLLLRAVFTQFGPAGDVYLLALVVGTLMSYERWRRRRGSDVIALGEQLAALEPATGRPAPEATTLLPTSDSEATYLVFTYPAASRLGAYLGAVLCAFFGIGFLLSLILHPTDDPANSWVLFIIGVLSLVGLVWSGWKLSWIGASVAVSGSDLVHRSPTGRLTRLPWETLTRITRDRFPRAITFWGPGGTQIRIYSPIAENGALHQAVRAILQPPGADAS
jgi:hypothetical protein